MGGEDIAAISSLLSSVHPSEAPPTSTTQLGVWSETLKLLRNLCAELPSNQACIMQVHRRSSLQELLLCQHRSHAEALPRAGELVERFGGILEQAALCTTALQLMGNICVGQRSGQEAVWRICFPSVFR